MATLEHRVTRLEESHTQILAEFQALGARMDSNHDAVMRRLGEHDKRFDSVTSEIAGLHTEINTKHDAVIRRLDEHDKRFDSVMRELGRQSSDGVLN